MRRRWTHAYMTPLQFGIYRSVGNTGPNDTILARIETELGLIVPGTARRLEFGLAGGIGVLAIGYSRQCETTCRLGGAGLLFSPVIRYLFRDGPNVTIGASVRAIVPLPTLSTELCFGYCRGFGSILLGGVEFGFGRGVLK
jgi:hypothetical protein